MKKENSQETRTITEVKSHKDWYWISQDSLCVGLKKKYGVTPKVGDKLTTHTKGGTFGTIRGMDLNGVKVFWYTDEELEANRIEWLRKNEEDKQKKFKDSVAEMDKQYEALPECFRKRIDKYRQNNDRFRIDYESYELFCCEQAVIIANGCKTIGVIKKFITLPWDEQKKMIPELDEGHSGNTFGAACSLAHWYLKNPVNVVRMHGSIAPLVGSAEYGDEPQEINLKK